MSSAIYYQPDGPISLSEWESFCTKHGIKYSPNTVGQNVYYADQVEIVFGGKEEFGTVERAGNGFPRWETARPPAQASEITVSTRWMGGAQPAVADLAIAMFRRWGGKLQASPELETAISSAGEK